jgi:endogenous inhibitor of DNA gyrase (YacG/DUF329 family)
MPDQPPESTRPANTPRCPQCNKPRQQQFRPFCSARCRDVDLGKWFSGSYAIPVKDDDYDDQAPPGGGT